MGSPDVIKRSLLGDEEGWVDVGRNMYDIQIYLKLEIAPIFRFLKRGCYSKENPCRQRKYIVVFTGAGGW